MTSVSPQWIHKNIHHEEVLFIDVRERSEYYHEHIKNAINIPLAELEDSINNIPKDKTVIFYCKSGARSQKAFQKMIHHFSDARCFSLAGGIEAWKKEFDIDRSAAKCLITLSIERQTFVAIGMFLILGAILAYTINSLFHGVPFFIGGGIIFAGLSGFCGMTKFLAKMPWNK